MPRRGPLGMARRDQRYDIAFTPRLIRRKGEKTRHVVIVHGDRQNALAHAHFLRQAIGMTAFDVIGDIHGHADALTRLLIVLGYREQAGIYRHATRTAVFLGDFVDRGPHQREALRIARAMVEKGAARAVMGNHEFNAIAYATPDGEGGYLRPHTPKNRAQHSAFLDQIGEGTGEHADAVAWFKTLPLWLDLDGLRIVHACWSANAQRNLAGYLDDQLRLTEHGVFEVNLHGGAAYEAAEILLKGPEARLPGGQSFQDKDGHLRHEARFRWWDPAATTFRTAALGMEDRQHVLPDYPVPADFAYFDATPVLFGHYWMRGEPHLLSPRASCLDFSVAKGGVLTAYRWSGEAVLKAENLIWVPASAV
jgi:hypothetical protein